MAEKKRKTALEAEITNMADEATYGEIYNAGPGEYFKPKPHDEQVPMELTYQRLDAIYDEEPLGFEKDPVISSAKMLAQDPLEEIDLGVGSTKRITYISIKLDPKLKVRVIELLRENKDCFAWDYDEMPGLKRELVELKFPIKDGKKPIKQTPRRFAPEILSKIKKEVERLLRCNFIRTTRYVKWIANIVPVIKKNGSLRVCIDFRDPNAATLKDEYPMSVAEMLVDSAAGYEYLSMLDGYSGYNQIFIAEEDVSKTAFRCPGAIGTYEWIVMPFGLKNAGATYQQAMNSIFHDYIETFMQAGDFLGFVVHEKGIEISQNKTKAIMETKAPSIKKELQSLLGKINFLRRFISKLSGRTQAFSPLLRLKQGKYEWNDEHQKAFEKIKHYLTNPLILSPPCGKKPMRLYISASDTTIGSMYMLSKPIMHSQIGKWTLALTKYSLAFMPLRVMKGQIISDFIVDHAVVESPQLQVELKPWRLFFDGSTHKDGSGVGIMIISLEGIPTKLKYRIEGPLCSNNKAKYEALIAGLEALLELGSTRVEIKEDSKLVIKRLTKEYKCIKENLIMYFVIANRLLKKFEYIDIKHVPRIKTQEANDLAQIASGYRISKEKLEELVEVRGKAMAARLSLTDLESTQLGYTNKEEFEVLAIDTLMDSDWRNPIFYYLKDPSIDTERKTKYRALSYVLIGNELFKKTLEGILLKCLGENEACLALSSVHSGACGAHQAGHKMKLLLFRYGMYWPTMLKDCELHAIIKPWPFRGWALDLIGEIRPTSSKGQKYILVGIDYFTKWVEAVPLVNVDQETAIEFIQRQILYRFGIPESIRIDQGSVFTSQKMQEFAKEMGFKLLTSTPYYAQANGQVEAGNKVIIGLIKKHVGKKPKNWHKTLDQALWACRTSPKEATNTTHFQLTFGHDAVLPIEIYLQSVRIQRQGEIPSDLYWEMMMNELVDLDEERLHALEVLRRQKDRIVRAYNKRVKGKTFIMNDLVWKVILPMDRKNKTLGKWSPHWEGPFQILKAFSNNAYEI
ncbi:uncharacterized protein LOC127101322 [Lathyrus oleraceus]|uniref:uncharacterized protein LOC127101322 n=1 Tax=Pisum sativum TaxID=3888 RepID=UPI0021D307F6|nr:uncharacterized protein LOC127101322 [Pisum sativum]